MERTSILPNTVFYHDELNDDFSGIHRPKKFIVDDYKYINNNLFYRIGRFIVYRIVMTPVAFLYCKIKFHHKIVNKKVLKPYRHHGYFMYANHTQIVADAYIPNMICFPKDTYEVVNSDNMALKGTETFMKMLGAMPIPSTIHGVQNFLNAIERRLVDGNVITIYPEAHLWPYFTGIRNFKSVSFKYPVRFNDPCFCFTNCYKKRRFGKKARIVTFIDGPFLPNLQLPENERHLDLRNRIYETMKSRASKESTYARIKYVKDTRKFKND